MSEHIPTLTTFQLTRLAVRFTAEAVRSLMPRAVIGAYLLLREGEPVYIGRSDNCLRTRLSKHPLLGEVSHVAWQPCRNAQHAYMLEAYWFHRLKDAATTLNSIHPARPHNWSRECPFCTRNTREAFHLAVTGTPRSSKEDTNGSIFKCGTCLTS